ncbi:MAG TPA: hypothetical protein VFI42_13200 [Thermomicrobiaceae bacterium]|nr:hypothetical protein [Thermomicrobiaceae bacterium]
MVVALAVVLALVVTLPRPSTVTPATTSPVAGVSPTAVSRVPAGPYPAPEEITFHGCPPGGDGTDPTLNRLKNRIDPVQRPSPVEAGDLLALPWPEAVDNRHMDNWPPEARAAVARYNGVGLVLEGYLVRVAAEGAESTNCHSTAPDEIDFHVWIAAHPGDARTAAVVVEFTPRLRAVHDGWALKTLQQLAREKAPVRITGWLMLDPEHPEQVGKTRGTIWEIHPVTKIEVEQGGRWVDLDTPGG